MRTAGNTRSTAARWVHQARLTMVTVLSVFLVGCETTELSGPDRVDSGQLVTYTLEMGPYYSRSNATVYVVAEIPETWDPVGWAYEGEIDGGNVSGEGGFEPGEPGLCTAMPAIPYGYKRVFASEGPFATLAHGRDIVTADLEFMTGAQPGVFELRFFVHVKYPSGVDCGYEGADWIEVIQDGDWEWEMVVGEGSPVDPGLGGRAGDFQGWTEFSGQFYTTVHMTPGAEIWRTADLTTWELVHESTSGGFYHGLMTSFGDRLYVVAITQSERGDYISQVWTTEDGSTWEMAVEFEGYAYSFGTYDAELILITRAMDGMTMRSSVNGFDWVVVGGGPFGSPDYIASYLEEYQGVLFIGGFDATAQNDIAMIWIYDGSTISAFPTSGLWSDRSHVSSLLEFNGLLYVGIHDYDGAELWTFDGESSWLQVIGPSATLLPNSGVYFLSLYDDRIFASISSGSWFRIWFSRDGLSWRESGLSSDTTLYQNRFMATAMGDLFVATGTRLWRRGTLFADGFETGGTSRWSSVIPADGGPI